MLLSTTTTLLFATSSLAFLIPGEINTNDLPKADFLPVSYETNSQTLSLDCSNCPFALKSQRDGTHEWTNDVESELEMTFDTDGKAINFNGVPFYPTNSILPPMLYVSQSKKDGQSSNMEGYDGNLRLSYSLEYNEKKVEDRSLVTMVMTVMGLDGQMVHVDNIKITVVKQADGTVGVSLIYPSSKPEANILLFLLHSVEPVPIDPNSPDAKCETTMCRFFTKVVTGMAKAKASAKSAGHKMKCFCVRCFHKLVGHKEHQVQPHHPYVGRPPKPWMPSRPSDDTMEFPTHIQFKPHSHSHHHHHEGVAHRVHMILRSTFKIVLVPILIGIAFGMAASAIGMLVGQAVVFLWMKFRGTARKAAYQPLDADDKDAPPAYQDIQQGAEALNEKEVDAKA